MAGEDDTRDERGGGRRRQPPTTPLRTRKPIARVRARREAERPWRRRVRRAALALAALTGLGVVAFLGVLAFFARDLPEVTSLRDYRPPQTTRVLDRHGEVVGEIFTERRTVVPMERIPRVMILSVLAAEDADFYLHEGLSYRGIVRAVLRDVLAGRAAQGASTITQQVVKLMLLSSERSFSRKVRELILARRLEQELSKDEILWLYLNHINFGQGRYGVQEAAQFYFGKNAEDLTLAEASLIAGVPQSPARLSPRAHPEAARRRQLYVLSQLAEKHATHWPDLPMEDIESARASETHVIAPPESSEAAPELMTVARQVLREQVGEEAFRNGGYTIHTTLDLALQRATREAVQKGVRELDARQGRRVPLEAPRGRRARGQRPLPTVDQLRPGRVYEAAVDAVDVAGERVVLDVGGHPAFVRFEEFGRYAPDGLDPDGLAEPGARVHVSILEVGAEDEPSHAQLELGPQAAAIVIDPRTRDVLALVGGYEARSGFDRALQALRQPGSTFKPIVYLQGLRTRAFTPASLVIDAPAVYDQWKPDNYETWYEGPVRLRAGLAASINSVAVRVMEEVGPPAVVALARELGIESELEPSMALALGASGVKPIEMVNAFATFAAGGRWEAPRFVRRIVAPDGSDVRLAERPPARDVVTPAEAYVLTSMLTSVVREGTATRAQRLERPVAGKTGTSNEARDAWFIGYSADMVAGVWVGFDDNRSLGRRESGGRSALPIWIDVMLAAETGRPVVDFPMPSGVVTATIDPETGLLGYEGMTGTLDEVFLEGTEPTETARPPDVADPNQFLMEQFMGGAPGAAPPGGTSPGGAHAPGPEGAALTPTSIAPAQAR